MVCWVFYTCKYRVKKHSWYTFAQYFCASAPNAFALNKLQNSVKGYLAFRSRVLAFFVAGK
jgi:hypothetical protein